MSNDRPPDRKDPLPPLRMGCSVRTFTLWLLLALMAYFLVSFLGSGQNSADIPYSRLLWYVSQGSVRSVIIETGGNVEGEFHSPQNVDGSNYETFVSFVPFEDTDIIDSLQTHGVAITARAPRVDFFQILLSVGPFLLLIGFWIYIMRNSGGGNKAFSFGKSRAKLFTSDRPKTTFEDVAGVDEAKEELEEVIEFLKQPKKFQRLGGKVPKGVLLLGPPGTGKTLLAKAVAGEASVPFFSMSGSDFVEMFVGVGASRVRDLFVQGKSKAPCILFIDEIDAVGRHRGAGLGGGHDEREQTLNALLVEMDGFEANEGVIVMAATNRPDVLDPALLRPGRFDRRIIVSMPDVKGREAILKVHTRKMPLSSDVNLCKLARSTPGFSGADLESLANEAALRAARRDAKEIFNEDFEYAVDRIVMGIERRSMVISPEEKNLTAVHESGHAVVGILTPDSDPVHKVSIVPRGLALGITSFLPIDDKHNYTYEYCRGVLARMLGGRASEVLFLDTISTGGGNDLERATALARKMICEWGMSKDLGPVSLGHSSEPVFLGRDMSRLRDYSEDTARMIDSETKNFIEEAYTRALEILIANKDIVEKLTELLLDKETLSSEEIRLMLAELRPGEIFPGIAVKSDDSAGESSGVTEGQTDNGSPEDRAGSQADPGRDRGES
jgi:cell division protease FtsH